jgi:hypothetical protein
MTTNNEWLVMVRQYSGSMPVPCRGSDGQVKRFPNEEKAQAYAKKCRDAISPYGACRPHFFAQLA